MVGSLAASVPLGTSTTITKCFDGWIAPEPTFPTDPEHERQFRLKPSAFTDCVGRKEWPGGCEWPNGCINVQVGHSVALEHRKLGSCGDAPNRDVPMHDAVEHASCDPRTFIPLDVVEGGYLPHFIDQIAGKLAMALELAGLPAAACATPHEAPLLIYTPAEHASADTHEALATIGATLTHTFPDGRCFHRVIWACDAAPFHREMMMRARALFRMPRAPSTPVCTSRVYASRQRRTKNGRVLINEKEVIAHLQRPRGQRSKPFNTILYGDEPFAVKVRAVSDACVLAGPHGGALYYMHWMQQGRAVIEIDGYDRYKVFYALAGAYDLLYGFVHFDPGKGVDVSALDEVIDRLEQRMKHDT